MFCSDIEEEIEEIEMGTDNVEPTITTSNSDTIQVVQPKPAGK